MRRFSCGQCISVSLFHSFPQIIDFKIPAPVNSSGVVTFVTNTQDQCLVVYLNWKRNSMFFRFSWNNISFRFITCYSFARWLGVNLSSIKYFKSKFDRCDWVSWFHKFLELYVSHWNMLKENSKTLEIIGYVYDSFKSLLFIILWSHTHLM